MKFSSVRRWALAALAFAAAHTDDAYSRSCASCHGPELRGGETGPTLIGTAFQQRRGTRAPEELELFIRRTMPPTNPGSSSEADYASTLKRIRVANGWSADTLSYRPIQQRPPPAIVGDAIVVGVASLPAGHRLPTLRCRVGCEHTTRIVER